MFVFGGVVEDAARCVSVSSCSTRFWIGRLSARREEREKGTDLGSSLQRTWEYRSGSRSDNYPATSASASDCSPQYYQLALSIPILESTHTSASFTAPREQIRLTQKQSSQLPSKPRQSSSTTHNR